MGRLYSTLDAREAVSTHPPCNLCAGWSGEEGRRLSHILCPETHQIITSRVWCMPFISLLVKEIIEMVMEVSEIVDLLQGWTRGWTHEGYLVLGTESPRADVFIEGNNVSHGRLGFSGNMG
jgi:hypothetical protein